MKRMALTREKLSSDPDLNNRFESYLRSNFSYDGHQIIGPYRSRNIQKPLHSNTSYWKIYLYFEDFKWWIDEHCLIKFIVTGSWGGHADHIDHNGLNNTSTNLRFVSVSENQRNRLANKYSSSGYPGVHKNKYGWHVKLCSRVDGVFKTEYFGTFTNLKDACLKSKAVRLASGRIPDLPIPEGL